MINPSFSQSGMAMSSPMNMSSMGMMGYPYMMGGGMYPPSMMSMGLSTNGLSDDATFSNVSLSKNVLGLKLNC